MTKNRFTRATCDNCSAPLSITGDEKVVICEFCSTSHIVPQNLLESIADNSKYSGSSLKSLSDDQHVIKEARDKFISDAQQEIDNFKNEREKRIQALKQSKLQRPKYLILAIIFGVFSLVFCFIGLGMILIYSSGEESASFLVDLIGAGFTVFLIVQFVRQILKFKKAKEEIRSSETDLETIYSLDNISKLENDMAQNEEKYNKRLSEIKNQLDSKIGI
jgi:hypothetical protein